MNFKLQENINLAELTTFKIGGRAKYYTEVSNTQQLPEIFEWLKEKKLPYFVLGGGSNTIFDDGTFNGLVIKINLLGFKLIQENDESASVWVASGEDWDKTVAKTVELGLSGIEALSLIPGQAGTAPVQNIGAYGQEIMNVIESVEAFDTQSSHNVVLSKAQCEFSYRDSIFKSSQKGRYIITAINMKLSKNTPKLPNYPDVIEYFKTKNISKPTLSEIREAIIDIRTRKLPNPNKIPNAGSFFKNPIVNVSRANELKQKFPEIRMFEMPDGTIKLFAGWLIEQAGLKGKKLANVQVDPKHALVLENIGGASQKDLQELINAIQAEVKNKFGILLEPEPVIVKF